MTTFVICKNFRFQKDEHYILKALCAGEEGGAVHPHPVPDARHHKLPVLHQPEEGAEHLRASVRLHAGQLYPQVITGTWKICKI